MLQNHALQIVTLLAMEPPVGPESSFLHDEKAKVLAAMEPIDPRQMVRGQYIGYRDEPGVDPNSTVGTFVAVRLMIDSWRWAGVPWYVRVGKALERDVSEAVVELREPPQLLFDEAGGPPPGRNLVRFRLGKRDGVTFALQAKSPGPHMDSQEVDISVDFAAALGERQDAYERLLLDAIDGSPRRFARRGRRRAHVARRPAGPRRPGPDLPVLPGHDGPGRSRPHPRRRHVVPTLLMSFWARRVPYSRTSAPRWPFATIRAQFAGTRSIASRDWTRSLFKSSGPTWVSPRALVADPHDDAGDVVAEAVGSAAGQLVAQRMADLLG